MTQPLMTSRSGVEHGVHCGPERLSSEELNGLEARLDFRYSRRRVISEGSRRRIGDIRFAILRLASSVAPCARFALFSRLKDRGAYLAVRDGWIANAKRSRE